MYPTLQNGDLVVFKGVNPTSVIPNGTIILFVQSDTGNSALDALIRPIVIHRIIGTVTESNGQVYYQTKGDNNALNDSQLVEANHVLGIPVKAVPRVGLVLMFFESPQGLVTIVVIVVILYMSNNETKIRSEKERKIFLGALAQMVLNDELSEATFRKIELATEYSDDLSLDRIRDPTSLAMLDWLKKGGLEYQWAQKKISCPKCSELASSFETAKGNLLIICPFCIEGKIKN
jgi:signal peptidase I